MWSNSLYPDSRVPNPKCQKFPLIAEKLPQLIQNQWRKLPPNFFFWFFSDGKCGSRIQEIDLVKGRDMPRTNSTPNSNNLQISESNYSENVKTRKCRNQLEITTNVIQLLISRIQSAQTKMPEIPPWLRKKMLQIFRNHQSRNQHQGLKMTQ